MVLQKKKIPFEKYLIPVLPHLQYEKDGNVQDGEVLFIADRSGSFTISFETGMACFDLLEHIQSGYHDMNLFKENKRLHICYPRQKKHLQTHMGYFHYELIDAKGRMHILPGQIGMVSPYQYEIILKAMTVLQDILFGLQLKTETGSEKFIKLGCATKKVG